MNDIRLNKIIANLKNYGLTQMIICDPSTIYYITGAWVHPGERMLALYISTEKQPVLFVNQLFPVPDDIGIEVVLHSDIENPINSLCKYTNHGEVMGVDKFWEAKFLLAFLEQGGATKCVNSSLCADVVRMQKDENEQKLMEISSQINDECMAEFKELLHEGVSEIEVSNKICEIFKAHGSEALSFEPIVGFGGNAADGHHEPDDTKLKFGDCVVLDVGCVKDGYCSDMTRTFFFGEVSEKAKKIYELVKKANETAIGIIKPGVRFCDIDKTARDIIDKEGYAVNFNHRLGHSIGFECHEAGDVSGANPECVKEGMVFSIEPGIYLKEELGVRIEDLVLVTKDGCKVLNHYPKELCVI